MASSRREVLKRFMALAAGSALPGMVSATEQFTKARRFFAWRNWSGAQFSLPMAQPVPASEAELADLIRSTKHGIRPVGSGHSFSALVPTDGIIVSLARMQGLISHDPATLQAEFWGGTHMSTMGQALHDIGQALPNMSDIDYQTLAGAVSTSTHGTGVKFGSYSSQITGLRLMTASGDHLDCDAQTNPEVFNAARVSLGALGILTRIRLQNRKPFRLHSKTWVADTDDLLDNMENLAGKNDHFELMPLIHSSKSLAIAHNETSMWPDPRQEEGDGDLATLMDAVYRHLRHSPGLRSALINFVSARLRFDEEVDDSWKVFASVRDVRFNEMEYTVPAEDGPACVREILKTIADNNLPSWFPLEYRYVKADDIPLSMFEGRDGCSISVHQFHEMDYHNFFAAVEPIFWKYGGRPHWGKLHSLHAAQLRSLYPRWNEFAEVRAELDPAGKFLNAHLKQVLGVGNS